MFLPGQLEVHSSFESSIDSSAPQNLSYGLASIRVLHSVSFSALVSDSLLEKLARSPFFAIHPAATSPHWRFKPRMLFPSFSWSLQLLVSMMDLEALESPKMLALECIRYCSIELNVCPSTLNDVRWWHCLAWAQLSHWVYYEVDPWYRAIMGSQVPFQHLLKMEFGSPMTPIPSFCSLHTILTTWNTATVTPDIPSTHSKNYQWSAPTNIVIFGILLLNLFICLYCIVCCAELCKIV